MNTDNVFRGYIACALWSESAYARVSDDGVIVEDPDNDQSFESLNFDMGHIDADALQEMRAEVDAFLEANTTDCEAWSRWFDDEQVGHDIWLTRNRHGAGFWDRFYAPGEQHDTGERLTQSAHALGESSLYFGDAHGVIYVS